MDEEIVTKVKEFKEKFIWQPNPKCKLYLTMAIKLSSEIMLEKTNVYLYMIWNFERN